MDAKAPATDAILRASIAREAIGQSLDLLGNVEERVDGRDLVDRDPTRAAALLTDSLVAIGRASDAGVAASSLDPLRGRIERGLDTFFAGRQPSCIGPARRSMG